MLRVRLPGVTAVGCNGSAATPTSSSPAAASGATSASISASPMQTLRRRRRACAATVDKLGRRPECSSCVCWQVLLWVLGMGAASSSSGKAASAAISSTASTRPRREAASWRRTAGVRVCGRSLDNHSLEWRNSHNARSVATSSAAAASAATSAATSAAISAAGTVQEGEGLVIGDAQVVDGGRQHGPGIQVDPRVGAAVQRGRRVAARGVEGALEPALGVPERIVALTRELRQQRGHEGARLVLVSLMLVRPRLRMPPVPTCNHHST